MFYDIVSNLSLSPAAATQLAFYWRRLKKEQLTRQLSILMAGMLVAIQIVTIIAPPDPANAAGPTNLITNGIPHSKSAVINVYMNNTEYRNLLNRYGVRKIDLENASVGKAYPSNHNLLSFGREPHDKNDKSVTIGSHTYFIRPLYKVALNSSFDVLEGRRHGDNKYFAIIFDCGNLVLTDLTPTNETLEVVSVTSNVPAPAPKPVPKPTPPVVHTPTQPAHDVTTTTPSPVITPVPVTTTAPTPTPAPSPANIIQAKSGLLTRLDGSKVDANGATAQAGETIKYTLTTQNTGGSTKKNVVVSDNVTDILEYADIDSMGGAVLQDNQLVWPQVDLNKDQTITNTFTVRIKSPIPSKPTSTSDPYSYDLRIDNVYHDVITTNLPAPTVAKQVEVASSTLPQTGPGVGTLIVFALVGAIAYFYFRNRQLVSEIAMLRNDHNGYGGGL
jgi:uncharacterized repeat protein (TIGR01451 family)